MITVKATKGRKTKREQLAVLHPRLRFASGFAIVVIFVAGLTFAFSAGAFAQKRKGQTAPRTSHSRDALSADAREMIELASDAVCRERLGDPKGSVPIDDMQARPSLPVNS